MKAINTLFQPQIMAKFTCTTHTGGFVHHYITMLRLEMEQFKTFKFKIL